MKNGGLNFKGLDFKKSRTHLARMSKEGDTYSNGSPVPKHHQVVVRVNDCNYKGTCLGRDLYSTENAKHIKDMSGHSLTNMFYGKWKRKSSDLGTWVESLELNTMVIAHEYYQCTVYLVKNGEVYKASIKRAITPKQNEIVNILKGLKYQ